MKRICIYLLLLFSTPLFAQVNLVPNPSFEDTVSCPLFANQVDKAVSWHSSGGSPDYFNECDWLTGTAGVPNNFVGFQYAHSGNAYCGSLLYDKNDPNYRECFTALLNNPLIIGEKYIISFYLSWAGTFSNRLACNKIGALLSTNNYNASLPAPINNYSQFYSDTIIIDSLNWVLIKGNFISDSNYTYITIGGFFEDSQTDTLQLAPSSHAYYYIDDIELKQDTITSESVNILNPSINIYPNPAKEKIEFVSKIKKIRTIQLLNTNGKVLIYKKIENQKEEINLGLNELKPGIYYIKVEYSNFTNSTYHKLIKQ